jgi:RNA polymerase sigma-70 factor (ECF subfamily)
VQDNDSEVIARLAQGELEALEVLYVRYVRPVYSLAARVLGDDVAAEEVTQDVFEQAWRQAKSYDQARGRVGTWLLTITHHTAVDVLRKRLRRPATVGGTGAELALKSVADPHSDVALQSIGNIDGVQVRRALQTLPEAQRRAIELAFFGGMSHAEIATALSQPLGTVKSNIRRGMQRLRHALQDVVGEGREA